MPFNLAFIKPFIIIFGLPRNYIQNFSIWVEKRSDLCYNLLNMKDHVTNLDEIFNLMREGILIIKI